MLFRVGTSGYAFKEWKGWFYPEDMPDAEMLRYYATRFSTVEINNTFYRMPKTKVVQEWAAQVPESFRFALKASQRITHHSRLKDTEENLTYMLSMFGALESKLGPTLFQLPPYLRKDVPRLEAFLALLPPDWNAVIEFRHESWWDDEVYRALEATGAALCIADNDEVETPLVATTDWGYVRLHRDMYDPAALATWVERLTQVKRWKETYVFFTHEGEGSGPPLAESFDQMVRRAL